MKHIAEIAYVGRRTSSAAAFVLLAALFVSGCETSSTLSSGPNPVKCVVALNSPPMMDAVGGTGFLNITTQRECAWDASSNVGWITALSPASGQGPAEVSFSVSANEGFSARDGAIEVNGTQAHVSQRAVCRYEVSPLSQSVGASGAVGRITVTTTGECTWRATSESEWIELTSSGAGTGSGTVTFAVRLNDGAQRTGAISVAGQRLLITQASSPAPVPPAPAPPSPTPPAPPACTYSISPEIDGAPPNDGAGSVTVSTTSTCRWTAASNVSWMTIASGSSGTGNGTVVYRFEFNLGPPRTGTLTIAGRIFTVRQGTILGSTP
jgi:VCBS repeat-containing protein